MHTAKKNIVFGCYGGGHVQSLIPVIKLLQKKTDLSIIVIGFTTARKAFERAGIEAYGYDYLLNNDDGEWLNLAKKYLPETTHPDVSENETLAYYSIGLKDLSLKYGRDEAIKMFKAEGRKVFFPVQTFIQFLKRNSPDIVVTSTSPRSELALQYAARALNINSLAVSDLFLQKESEYICNGNYSENITVMAEYVAQFLRVKGYKGKIYVTGNPAFDILNTSNLHRPLLREQLEIPENKKVILWVCPSASVSMIGKPFVKPEIIISFLENFCSKYHEYSYIVRQHPNHSIIDAKQVKSGVLCPSSISIEDCISAVDLVLLETSTVGLQAALTGLPVVTINAGNYPPYAELGISVDVSGMSELTDALLEARKPRLDKLSYPELGTAAEQVKNVILDIIS